jgi:type IV pilus assembly protein PilY1
MNKMDGDVFISGTTTSPVDREMSSAFYVLDITDPESPPTVLGEFAFTNLGYTTCYPTVIPMRNKVVAGDGSITFSDPGGWYLIFGSGPHGPDGADNTALTDVTSNQTAKLYVVDLVKLATDGELWTLDSSGVLQNSAEIFADLNAGADDADAFVSDVISVDFQLNYNTDAVYFGTIQGSEGSWGGKLRRVVMDDDTDPATWDADSTMLNLTPDPPGLSNGQPITAAPAIALDADGNRWIFVGTGRFFNRDDASNDDQQSYYGLKEPGDWSTIARTDLLDVSNGVVYEDGSDVEGVSGVDTFESLLSEIDSLSGWLLDFPDAKERNLGQATLLGDILTFTTYVPSLDPCEFEGESFLYAVYYKTGTAWLESVIGLGTLEKEGKKEVLRRTSLGQGLSITPNIHTGRQEGSTVFVQTSTGAIEVVDQANPGLTSSGRLSWEEE